MTISYITGIPATNNNPSVDQPNMQTNTNAIDQWVAVDHVGFNTLNGGKHKQTTFINETIPSVAAGQSAFWSQVSGQSQVFATSDAGANAYQMTRMIDASFAKFGTDTALTVFSGNGTGTGGWTFLPGGLLLQYANCTSGTTSGGTIFNFPISFTGAPFVVLASPNIGLNNRFFINVTQFTTTTFTVNLQSNGGVDINQGYSLIAIGV